jgi:excisionase family DNA binding protein
MSQRTPPQTVANIRELDELGWGFTVAELATGFNISPATVRRILDGPKPPPPIDAPTYTVPQLARLLRVSPGKVRTWIRSGTLAASNVGTTRPRFVVTKDALDAFLKARQPEPPKRRPKPVRVNGFKRY